MCNIWETIVRAIGIESLEFSWNFQLPGGLDKEERIEEGRGLISAQRRYSSASKSFFEPYYDAALNTMNRPTFVELSSR